MQCAILEKVDDVIPWSTCSYWRIHIIIRTSFGSSLRLHVASNVRPLDVGVAQTVANYRFPGAYVNRLLHAVRPMHVASATASASAAATATAAAAPWNSATDVWNSGHIVIGKRLCGIIFIFIIQVQYVSAKQRRWSRDARVTWRCITRSSLVPLSAPPWPLSPPYPSVSRRRLPYFFAPVKTSFQTTASRL